MFHRVDKSQPGMEWQWGDLSAPIYPNLDGTHLADRYRASFWNRLRRNEYYADFAKIVGRVPLQRLGEGMLYPNVHEVFHFVMGANDIQDWRSRRAVEAVFYSHPNAKVIVHLKETSPLDLGNLCILIETGYDVEVIDFKPQNAAIQIDGRPLHAKEFERKSVQLASILWEHGGVLLSTRTYIRQQLSADVFPGYSLNDEGNVAMMVSAKGETSVLKKILSPATHAKNMLINENITGASQHWNLATLNASETLACMQDVNWKLPNGDAVAATFARVGEDDAHIKLDTECYQIVEGHCIYCDEVHWEY